MTDEGLLLIGAFARLVGLSPSALRFYDDCGLLPPARTDPASGYRSYAAGQEARAVLLRDLRAAGLPLPEVRVVLDGTPEEAVRVVRAHVRALEDRLGPARRTAAAVLDVLGARADSWQVRLGGPELASAVRQVAPAASTDADLPALGGVLLDVGADEVRLVATDRYRLAVRVLPAPAGALPGRALLPAPALQALGGWLRAQPEVLLRGDRDGVELVGDGAAHRVDLLAGDFPDYAVLLAALAPPVARVVVDRLALLEVLSADGLPAPVALSLEPGRLVVAEPDGAVLAELPAAGGGTSRLGFAPGLLAAALAAGVGPDVLLEVAGPDRPVVVRSADQGSFTVLVMPTLLPGA